MTVEASIKELAAWLARPSAVRDVLWAHDACALSREVYQELGLLHPEPGIVLDTIIPLLERVRDAIGELPAEAGPPAQIRRFVRNLELRIADVRAYANGTPLDGVVAGRAARSSSKRRAGTM
jgi:hypothetical protein